MNSLKKWKRSYQRKSHIAEPKTLPNPTQTLAIPNHEPSEQEETPILDFMLDFEDKLFAKYGTTSKYHTVGVFYR